MADWDGRGLPPVAAERIARYAEGSPRTSLLSVPGAAGVASVGLDPVGEVMGCIVSHIGFSGWQGCGYGWGFGGGYGSGYGGVSVRLPGGFAGPLNVGAVGSPSPFGGFAPYVDALYHGYRTALARMVREARGLHADGVVGVRLQVNRMDSGNREFVALGTAVRARGERRPARPFTTDLAGQDVAKLLRAGWVPSDIAIGISVAIRHDDWTTRTQTYWSTGNVEITGYTELVTHVRADARRQFEDAIRASGADGAVVSAMGLDMWAIEPAENHRDHVAEATVFGTSIARFHTGHAAPTRSLTILPLRSAATSGRKS